MNEITNLTKLEIFNYIDTKAAVTDFAVLSGAFVSNCYANDSDRTLANRTGFYWLNNSCGNNACAVGYLGNMVVQRVSNRVIAFRPVMLLFNGISFSYSKEFMNEYFLKELTQPITITQTKPVGCSRTLKK